jgi:predicted AAA+ superfamily ATPase
VNTLWGELAVQLLGAEGYALLADADRPAPRPARRCWWRCWQQAAPCVILLDELVAYVRQFEPGKSYPGGTFESNISFIQALTEAMKAVPSAMLLASLPQSDTETAGTQGQRALDVLEKYFGRVESVWKPVAAEEAFEIVRRRLFDSVGDPAQVSATARAFGALYRQHPTSSPPRRRRGATRSASLTPTRSIRRCSTGYTRTGPRWTSSSARAACCSTWPS